MSIVFYINKDGFLVRHSLHLDSPIPIYELRITNQNSPIPKLAPRP